MTAQPAGPAPGLYQTIRRGGQDAAVVPLADLARWRNRAEPAGPCPELVVTAVTGRARTPAAVAVATSSSAARSARAPGICGGGR
jgi:hypothetical protein